ncbi:hypothetical protein C0Q70_17933 [Pomacea canaliculata]|uniref:Uncharacterized protein n=1 Tax=Pomacea canaliculata TaxID=400727 RepID=A0A2T7NLT7_POMCA|nr:hypothetical protein C0Q70_17933 [Pomacea canaliculata]
MAIRPPGYSLVLTGTAISRVPLRDFWVGGGDAPVSTNMSIGTVRLLRGNGEQVNEARILNCRSKSRESRAEAEIP